MSRTIIAAVLFIVLCLTALSYGGNKMTICIDPGHNAVEAGRAQCITKRTEGCIPHPIPVPVSMILTQCITKGSEGCI